MFRVHGSGFRVQGLERKIWGLKDAVFRARSIQRPALSSSSFLDPVRNVLESRNLLNKFSDQSRSSPLPLPTDIANPARFVPFLGSRFQGFDVTTG